MKYLIILLIISISIIFSGCEGSLEPQVFDQIAPQSFFKTESDFKAAVTGIYHKYRQHTWGSYNFAQNSWWANNEGQTDEFDCNWGWTDEQQFLWTASTGWATAFYGIYIPAVSQSTALIARLNSSEVAESVKKEYMAEVRCMRAFFAYDLFDFYGPVVLVTDPEIALNPQKYADYKPSRPTKEWYVNFLETELNEAAADLPVNASEWGRVTKGTALMVLVKLYLHEKQWSKLADVTKQIMDLNYYQLQSDFASIWHYTNKKNKEIIFAIPSLNINDYGNNYLAHVLPGDYVSKNGINLTKWSGFRMRWTFYDKIPDADKRKERFLASYWNGTTYISDRTGSSLIRGAIPMKYQENPITDGQNDASDIVIYRYADVLLARAEALNELNGPNPETIDLMNTVRKRAFDNYDTSVYKLELSTYTTKEALRDRILAERGFELAFEGCRRPDLIRHGKYISSAKERGMTFADAHHVLFPIPMSAIYENNNIQQNPGY
ncbi:MAG TPA: RagB/SusD family nutrient uptake outer membrane protein [Prolixibacteraceae bacterium]|nr:RagB/SusD family nutrient uptake outer membrane protein [Prolixibacteraceae bacterium]